MMRASKIKHNTLSPVNFAILGMLRKAEREEGYTNPWQKIKLMVESSVIRGLRPLLLIVRPVACERATVYERVKSRSHIKEDILDRSEDGVELVG